VGDHVADGLAEARRRGFVLAGADARQFLAQPAGGGQQEVAGAAGRVEDFDGEQGVLGE